MRRITLLFALALAAVLALPGLVGQLARVRHEALVDALAASIEGARLASSVYEPGWFTSRAIHRIAFDGPAYRKLERDLTGVGPNGAAPALVVDSRLAHGPWPGGVGLAFMAIRSELSVQASDGASIGIPGDVRTRIGLDGGGQSRFVSPGLAEALRVGTGYASWDGADLTVSFADGARQLESAGTIGRLVLTGAAGELVLGEVDLEGRSRRSAFGFWTGVSELRVERLQVIAPDGRVVAGERLRFAGDVSETDELVAFRFSLRADGVQGGAVTDASLSAALTGARIDAAEWGRYLAIRRSAERGDAVDFARLARAGPRVGLEELTLVSPDGEFRAAADLSLPADGRARGPLTALASAHGEGTLSVSPVMLARLAQSGDGLRQAAQLLLAAGYLREQEGRYTGEFRLRDGLLTVNGRPFALPR
jgi:hypothetical protein